jgi:hypothetical protein
MKLQLAAVLILLTVVLSAAGAEGTPGKPDPPSDAVIWSAVISEIVKKTPEGQAGPGLRILTVPKDYPPPPGTGGRQGPAFSAQTRAEIERLVVTTMPIEWTDHVQGCEYPRPTGRFVAVGPIAFHGDHSEVMTYDARGCYYATWATYRVDRVGRVTGVVGAPTGMAPAGG